MWLNINEVKIIGGLDIKIFIMDIKNVDIEILRILNFIWFIFWFLLEDWKNIVFDIIIRYKRVSKYESFWICVNLFCCGWKNSDNYKWCFVIWVCVLLDRCFLREIRFGVDIGIMWLRV